MLRGSAAILTALTVPLMIYAMMHESRRWTLYVVIGIFALVTVIDVVSYLDDREKRRDRWDAD